MEQTLVSVSSPLSHTCIKERQSYANDVKSNRQDRFLNGSTHFACSSYKLRRTPVSRNCFINDLCIGVFPSVTLAYILFLQNTEWWHCWSCSFSLRLLCVCHFVFEVSATHFAFLYTSAEGRRQKVFGRLGKKIYRYYKGIIRENIKI